MEDQVEILIAEDSLTQSLKLQFMLEKQGYSVTAAPNGAEALDCLSENRPTMIISDVMMPKMDGFELCEHVKADESLRDIPLILLTTLSDASNIVKGLQCGADNFITKPYTEEFLLSRVRYMLMNRELRRNATAEMGIEVFFAGRKHFLSSERIQILDLLLSSYETSVHQNAELEQKSLQLTKALASIKTLESNYRALFRASADAMVVVDREGTVRYVNPAAETLFHRTSEQFLGKPFDFPVAPGEAKEIEIGSGGGATIAEMRVVVMLWEDDTVYLVTFHDVTARKQAQVEVERTQQQQLHMKDQFLSHVSHELRSPLTTIEQLVTILRDELAGEISPGQHERLDLALKNVSQMQGMIGNLLEAIRVQTDKLTVRSQSAPLSELVDKALASMKEPASEKNIALTVDVSDDLPAVHADPERVRQVLVHLIGNGIKFTPDGGRIIVRARVADDDPDYVRVAVSDTGCGIDPGECERIFEHLYRTDEDTGADHHGLGLGLYLCKELVTRQGGRIWVTSQPGEGSTFLFTLPVFSLTNSLAPVFTPENLAKGSAALMTVRARAVGKGRPAQADESAIRAVKDVLENYTLPDKDALLPAIHQPNGATTFLVVASADQQGAEVMVQRIREQLAGSSSLESAGLDMTVSFDLLDIPSGKKGKPLQGLVERVECGIKAITEAG